jgi:putative transposase
VARLPRLAIAGHPHHLIQRGNNRQPIVVDDTDRRLYLDILREASTLHRVALHAYVLMDDHAHLLATPYDAGALSDALQMLGRRYVGAFNRRHGRSGTLWEGRYRSGVVESGPFFLACMRYIEQNPVRAGLVASAEQWLWSSARHHLGLARDPLLTDHPLYWALGNTPFEREGAYRALLEQKVAPDVATQLRDAALKGWVLGSDSFVAALAQKTGRPLRPRSRGRPKRM